MSKRHHIGDVVLLYDDEEGTYLGRLDALGAERDDQCPQAMLHDSHDQACKEWPNVELLDEQGHRTGRWIYHVPECHMYELAARPLLDLAFKWRKDHGYIGRRGVVVIFQGEIQGWVDRLRNPEHWQPGCVAVDECGESWTATAGNASAGALMWLSNEAL
jgi:hypothetical protein